MFVVLLFLGELFKAFHCVLELSDISLGAGGHSVYLVFQLVGFLPDPTEGFALLIDLLLDALQLLLLLRQLPGAFGD